jgi:hypothetical protein
MKKLNKDEQVKLEIAKEAMIKLREVETLIYDHLVKDLGRDNDWLYDYIFNCNSTDNDVYTVMVRDKIFK